MTIPSHLPWLVVDEIGCRFFVCPQCKGHGSVSEEHNESSANGHKQRKVLVACAHCFGFGRLPVPKWYMEQLPPRDR